MKQTCFYFYHDSSKIILKYHFYQLSTRYFGFVTTKCNLKCSRSYSAVRQFIRLEWSALSVAAGQLPVVATGSQGSRARPDVEKHRIYTCWHKSGFSHSTLPIMNECFKAFSQSLSWRFLEIYEGLDLDLNLETRQRLQIPGYSLGSWGFSEYV